MNSVPYRTQVADVTGVVALLQRAGTRLKYPKLWLQLPGKQPLRITIAGSKSNTPGYVMLTDGEAFGMNKYFGRISPAGTFEIGRDGYAVREPLVALLGELAADPAKVAAAHGALTGHCCFCDLPLKDERSTAIGYGSTCAKNFGLAWGAKAAKGLRLKDATPLPLGPIQIVPVLRDSNSTEKEIHHGC